MRIIFFGDSLTWGGYGGNFVTAIAEAMPEHEIINAGQGGNTVINLLRRVDDDVIAKEPDAVFVMVGGNDSISYSQPATRPYYKKSMAIPEDGAVTPAMFVETYRELLTKLHLNHIHTLMGLAPAEYNAEVVRSKQNYNAKAADIARSMNIPVLDLQPHFNPKPEEMVDRPPISLKFIDTIGRRSANGWDAYEAERERNGYTYSFDGLHFTPDSVSRITDLIVPFLEENL